VIDIHQGGVLVVGFRNAEIRVEISGGGGEMPAPGAIAAMFLEGCIEGWVGRPLFYSRRIRLRCRYREQRRIACACGVCIQRVCHVVEDQASVLKCNGKNRVRTAAGGVL